MQNLITHLVVLATLNLMTFSLAWANNDISFGAVQWKNNSAFVKKLKSNPRTYKLTTDVLLRDNIPWNKEKTIQVTNDYPQLETGSPLLDGLYALTMQEVNENSVEQITDPSFSTSQCHCFETGRKWNYVWTRDIAYSAHLSLAALNQKRTLNSLLFKVSKRRAMGKHTSEIVQDTGTGGSWPVSTDRVVWSIAAAELLKYLEGSERQSFLNTAYTALKNTVDNDRIAVYDDRDGLYTGEQSFLDWREQTYPSWVSHNIIHVGMSKALSTNITHYTALKTTAEFALELGFTREFKKYMSMANALKKAINNSFWDKEKGLYSTYLITYLDETKVDKYDLLGNSLAIIFDIAETNAQKSALENYPMVTAGAPVITPQDPQAPIYHNRAIWPFVTQYALLAAQKSGQAKIYNHLFDSMVRGTALNLSNMENYEFISMNNWLDDGILSGPIVNSQRQLWSVAGMASTYLDGLIGKEVRGNKIRFNPFITDKIRNTVLKKSDRIELKGLKYKRKSIDVTIHLPMAKNKWNDHSYFSIKSYKVNGEKLPVASFIEHRKLAPNNNVEIILEHLTYSTERPIIYGINNPYQLSQYTYEKLFSPKTPTLHPIKAKGNHPQLFFESNSFEAVSFNIYRNGTKIADNIFGNNYVDRTANNITTPCYVVETVFKSSGNRSLHSEPHCLWKANSITVIAVTHPGTRGQGPLNYYSDHGKIYLKKWGSKEDELEFLGHKVIESGTYAIQLAYNNLGHINTGITSAVKMVKVFEEHSGKLITQKVFMMPHHVRERYWTDSNFVEVQLEAGKVYKFRLKDFYNMSYFEHFQTYLYRGGRSGAYNFANIAELKILRIK